MDLAAESGHLDIVEWLHRNRTEGCTEHALYNAVACGHLEVAKWLHKNRPDSRIDLAKKLIFVYNDIGLMEILNSIE